MGDASPKQMKYVRSLWEKAVRVGAVERDNPPPCLDPFNPQTPTSFEVSEEIEILLNLLENRS